jgi:hypothetical protein
MQVKRPKHCLNKTGCSGGLCAACINRNKIALDGYFLMQELEKLPASEQQTKVVNKLTEFIAVAETMALIKEG